MLPSITDEAAFGVSGFRAVSSRLSSFLRLSDMGYQGLRDFRGRGNLPLIVETLLMRCVAPAQTSVSIYGLPWCALFSFCFFRYLRWRFAFFFSAGFRAGPSVRNLTAKLLTLLLASATGIVRICGIDWTGTGTERGRSVPRGESAAGLRFRAYRQKMAMRAGARLTHPSCASSSTYPPSRAWVGHPLSWAPRCGRRWGQLRWLPMLREMERRITTGYRGGLLR